MTPQKLGTAIRNARRELGLRQDQLAAAANVGVRFIVDLEAGKPTAQIGKALAVLDALGLTVAIGGTSGKAPL
jgi:HTH-type transcriptional regulator / antitoxin HipB